MPIYEYKCLDCETHIEKMQKISDTLLTVCENCGGKLEKQLSLSGFQFKGAGWYVTDYSGKTSGKETEKSENSEKPEKTKKTEKNSDTDSTAKTETASKQTNDDTTSAKKETTPGKE